MQKTYNNNSLRIKPISIISSHDFGKNVQFQKISRGSSQWVTSHNYMSPRQNLYLRDGQDSKQYPSVETKDSPTTKWAPIFLLAYYKTIPTIISAHMESGVQTCVYKKNLGDFLHLLFGTVFGLEDAVSGIFVLSCQYTFRGTSTFLTSKRSTILFFP